MAESHSTLSHHQHPPHHGLSRHWLKMRTKTHSIIYRNCPGLSINNFPDTQKKNQLLIMDILQQLLAILVQILATNKLPTRDWLTWRGEVPWHLLLFTILCWWHLSRRYLPLAALVAHLGDVSMPLKRDIHCKSCFPYCWWRKVYPIIYKVLYIPGGAGFLPSTVAIVMFLFVVLTSSTHMKTLPHFGSTNRSV